MKILDKIVISPTPPSSKNVAWFDGKGIKIPNQGEWKSTGGSGGGSGIEIVESVDKLDPNAPVGSLASVAVPGKITETSVRDMQQPDASIIDQENGSINTANLNTVTTVSIDPSKVSFNGKDTMLYFCTENIKMMGGGEGTLLAIMTSLQGDVYTQSGMYMNTGTYEQKLYMFVQKDAEGTITVYQDQIDEFVKCFADNTFYYLGFFEHMSQGIEITKEDYIALDNIKVIAGIPSIVNIYIKENGWKEFLIQDLNKIKNSIQNKADTIVIKDITYGSTFIHPNTYYTYTVRYSSNVDFVFEEAEDTSKYSEYILEIQCPTAPTKVSFVNSEGSELPIKWPNGMAPTFEAGFTYIISIVNNFGVFSTFIN